MAEVIAITNQKGGVGKTTTALNLGASLIKKGYRVLFVDADPQCNLSYILKGDCRGQTIRELLEEKVTPKDVIQATEEGELIPSSPNLGSLDLTLNKEGKEFGLRKQLEPLKGRYDFIIIDSPPTLGLLTINILTAASGVIIPAQADILSLQGVGQLYTTIQAVKNFCNPGLKIHGILLTRHTERLVLGREMREMFQDTGRQLRIPIFKTAIREAVGVREAQASRQSIFKYFRRSKQAGDYEAFTEEFLKGHRH